VAASPSSADVVVVGGGVMGLHVAWKLAAAKVGRVVLLEKRRFGAGESGKSGAILRQHYSHATLIRMARESLADYAQLHEDTLATGGIGFQRPGMVVLVPARDRTTLAKNVALQRSLGVPAEVVDAKQLRELEPGATFDDDACGAFERDAAFVDPTLALPAIAAQARAAGATLVEGACVTDVVVTSGRGGGARHVEEVVLADGSRVATRTIVNCGGPWAARLLARVGVELPLEVVRPEQAFFAAPHDHRERGGDRHVVADVGNDVYWKREASGLTRVGRLSYDDDERVADPDHYDESASGAFLADCRARIARRVAAYLDAVSWGGCGALYTVTPDSQAVIGPVGDAASGSLVDGFVVCSGFSGHGFKLGPAVGRAIVEVVTGSTTTAAPNSSSAFDPAFFSPQRFARGESRKPAYERGVLG
jgi:glycine/D-amino acid oxidase-like deaminating enzyme